MGKAVFQFNGTAESRVLTLPKAAQRHAERSRKLSDEGGEALDRAGERQARLEAEKKAVKDKPDALAATRRSKGSGRPDKAFAQEKAARGRA